ncbi:MAG: histone deacetylase [Deltaproteobacteria bacterium]|nr:histone deacetylase [Deltaproteobacteria bacterium]
MNRVGFVYHPDYLLHAAPFEHPESPARLLAIVEHLASNGLADRMVSLSPGYPDESDILRVHDPDYLRKLEAACRRGDTTLDAEDTYLCRNSYTIALLSAGGAIAGAEAVATGSVRRAFCAVRPPGHHADRTTGMGFCLLNNVAIAARYLQARHGISRVFIVDWDVHHGNGTQAIFLEDPSVFFFSIHEHPSFLYPGTGRRWETGKGPGEGTTLNAPMSPGAGDEEYRMAFEQMLRPAVERFRPEIFLVSAGFDAHGDDPLADIHITAEGYRFMTRFVSEMADRYCGGRIVSVLEGGYEISSLVSSVETHVRELLGP